MKAKLKAQIAYRYFRDKNKDGFISVISSFSLAGIAIGVACLIIVMSVMNGYRVELQNLILGFGGHISITSSAPIKNSTIEELRQVEEINLLSITPLIEGQVLATSGANSAGILLRAINPSDLKPLINNNMILGNASSIEDNNSIIIGSALANRLFVSVGEEINLVSSQGYRSLLGIVPKLKTFRVGGIFETGMYQFDSTVAIMSLDIGRIYFSLEDRFNKIELDLIDPNEANIAKKIIKEKLGTGFSVTSWIDENSELIQALEIEAVVMFTILSLIIIVAGFNIISSLVMLVNDKLRDIAIFRTMGASRTDISTIFILTGNYIGIIGTAIGVLSGSLFAANIANIQLFLERVLGMSLFNPVVYYLSRLPSKVMISDILMITLLSLGLSFLATIYPSIKAAKKNPVEVL